MPTSLREAYKMKHPETLSGSIRNEFYNSEYINDYFINKKMNNEMSNRMNNEISSINHVGGNETYLNDKINQISDMTKKTKEYKEHKEHKEKEKEEINAKDYELIDLILNNKKCMKILKAILLSDNNNQYSFDYVNIIIICSIVSIIASIITLKYIK